MRRHWWVLILALAVTACGGSAATPMQPDGSDPNGGTVTGNKPGATATTAPPARLYGLNQLVTVKGWDLAIQKVERPGQRLAWSYFSTTAQASGTWFVVVVDLKNTGTEPRAVTLADFSLTSGGTSFAPAQEEWIAGYGELKRGKRLGEPVPPGVSVTYFTVYDVPPTAKDLHFTFKQDTKPVFAVGNATK